MGCMVAEHLPICVVCSVFGWQSRVAGACCFIISQLCDSGVVSNAWMAAGTICSISGWQILTDLLLANSVIVVWSAVRCTVAEHLPICVLCSVWVAALGWRLLVALLLASCVIAGLSAVRGWLQVPSAVFLGDRYLLTYY